MSKIISKTKDGYNLYLEALTPQEINEAKEFLNILKREIAVFEKELAAKCNANSLEYKYLIGEFLDNKIMSQGITQHERRYVWEEIKNFVDTSIETTKDRGKKREFYDYCYRLYKFGKDLVFSFTWRQWSEFLDRSVTTKDIRLLYWLRENKLKEEDFRMFMVVINEYMKNHDTSVFEDDELFHKYKFLLQIVIQYNLLLNDFFDGDVKNLSKARREKLTKYKKKYITSVLAASKFKKVEDMPEICKENFISLFVDVNLNNNLRK